MLRLRTLVAVLVTAAGIGAGAAWAASGGSTTTPTTSTPRTTTPSAPAPNGMHHCPNMGNGSSSSGASYGGPSNL
jgi:hypothetical protein